MVKHSIALVIPSLLIAALLLSQKAIGQNTLPGWSLAGNSNASGTSKFGTTNAIYLGMFTNNLERMRITSSGNVGINTANPLTSLHVNGFGSFGSHVTSANATRAFNLVDANAVLRILRVHATFAPAVELMSRKTPDGPNVAYWDCYAEPSDASYRIRDRRVDNPGLDRFIIDSTGNIGIGISSPTDKLHVVANGFVSAVHAESYYIDDATGSPYGGPAIVAIGGDIGIQAKSLGKFSAGVDAHGTVGIKATGLDYGLQASGDIAVSGTGITGIEGIGSDLGVSGTGTNAGIRGFSDYAAVWGTGGQIGIYGEGAVGIYGSGTTYAGQFDGAVLASEGYITSDKNLKKNVREFADAMSIINKLKPRFYEYKDDEKFASFRLPKGSHYGLIAQELEVVLPNLVKEAPLKLYDMKVKSMNAKADSAKIHGKGEPAKKVLETMNVKAVNYVELIPVIIKGMQEQQNQIKELSKINEELQNQIADLKSMISKGANGSTAISSTGYLKQNVPNPSVNNTIIAYYLPGNTEGAQIRITDVVGKTVKVYSAPGGEGKVNISSSGLPVGTYIYSLFVKDQKIDSKKMVIAN